MRLMANLCTAFIAVFLFTVTFAAAKVSTNSVAPHPCPHDGQVDVELVLAVDISQSMDTEEQEVQRDGYVAALTSKQFLDAVQAGPIGCIAITYMEWGGVDEHFTVADWAVIRSADSATRFANIIQHSPLRQVQRTSIASALLASVDKMKTNDVDGMRRVIDVSGDGPNNQGGSVTDVRDKLVEMGVTINGLPLMMRSNKNTWQAMHNLDHYYEDCVIGGPSSFAIPVRSQAGFADAIRMKLVMEVAGLSPNDFKAQTLQRPRTQPLLWQASIQAPLIDQFFNDVLEQIRKTEAQLKQPQIVSQRRGKLLCDLFD